MNTKYYNQYYLPTEESIVDSTIDIIDRLKKPHVKLNNWYPYGKCLMGECVDHPRLGNTLMITSVVIFFDEANSIAETLNTVYLLGPKRSV